MIIKTILLANESEMRSTMDGESLIDKLLTIEKFKIQDGNLKICTSIVINSRDKQLVLFNIYLKTIRRFGIISIIISLNNS